MKVAFFTEGTLKGKIPRDYENMRTDMAWLCALEADRIPFHLTHTITQKYDLGIIIIPKQNPNFDIEVFKNYCDKIAVMQEGPHWYFQDYDIERQIWYFNTLTTADIIYVHNQSDKDYYKGLTDHHDIRILPTLMIEDSIGQLAEVERSDVIIGGNFVSWYGGFDSYIVASEVSEKVYAPSMGRRKSMEEHLIHHLPFMSWRNWIHELNKFKIGIHLMRTHAAGTFALNCAYLGIPCIGYEGLDTQQICHPECTVKIGDLSAAKKIAKRLCNDERFYLYCSNKAKVSYKENFSEDIFIANVKNTK
jgi:hypothetical protein